MRPISTATMTIFPDSALSGRLARGSIASLATHLAGAGLTYCSQLVIARIVGASSYGIYAYVFAWMTMLAYFSALGFDISILRLVPGYQARRSWRLVRGVIRYAETRAITVGVGIVVIGVCAVMIYGRSLSSELSRTFLIGFVLVPVWALLWIRSATVRAFGGVVTALAPDRLVRDGLLLGLIVLVSVAGWQNIDAVLAMLLTLASSGIGLGLVSLAVRYWRPREASGVQPEYDGKAWRRTALPLVLTAVAETAMNRTGVVLLGWTGHTKEAGIYALAFNVAFLVMLPRMAINTLFAPMIADLYVRNERAALQSLINKATLWTLIGAACVAVPLSLLAGPLLGWFGRGFGSGVTSLHLLLVAQVIAAGAGSQMFLLTMTGHERAAAVLLLSCTVLNAGLTVGLIQLVGLTGAAIATTAAIILLNLAMALFVWRKLRLLPGIFAIFRSPLHGEDLHPQPQMEP